MLGFYALGGLDADEEARIARHLRVCVECRAQYERIAALPALLDLAEPTARTETRAADVPAQPPAPPRRRVLVSASMRRYVVASAGAFVAALTALAAAVILSTGEQESIQVRLSPPAGGKGTATARLTERDTGTNVELDARLPPLRDGELYELWFARGDARVSGGTFTVDDRGRAQLSLTTAARTDGYDRIGITREPDGVDPARNGPNVMSGMLPPTSR